jgi:hypothetical protein
MRATLMHMWTLENEGTVICRGQDFLVTGFLRYCRAVMAHMFFAKLRKATVVFVMSVCPHGSTRLPLDGFNETRYLVPPPPPKSVEKVQLLLKSDNNNGYFKTFSHL